MKPKLKVRVTQRATFGEAFPPTARILFEAQFSNGKTPNYTSFAVNALPPTVNHMYISFGGKRILSKESLAFRELVAIACMGRQTWKPTGAVMVMAFLLSPYWVTKERVMRHADGDNRLKPLLDAAQHALNVPDHTNWEYHLWKVYAERTMTVVYMFDMGDLVEFYP